MAGVHLELEDALTFRDMVVYIYTQHGLELALGLALLILAGYLVFCPHSKKPPAAPIDMTEHSVVKQVEAKRKLRERYLNSNKRTVPADKGGSVPKGQTLIRNWQVLDLGLGIKEGAYHLWEQPSAWTLRVSGLQSGQDRILDLCRLEQLGVREYPSYDFHCVTGWSVLDLGFKGVPLPSLFEELKPVEGWNWMYQISADGYTTVVSREDIDKESCFLAIYDQYGELIDESHGGIRVLCPELYGYKSAKYLTEIRFLRAYEKGFWEKLGCHPRGRAFKEERWAENTTMIWNVLFWCIEQYRILFGNGVWLHVMDWGGRALGAFIRITSPILGCFGSRLQRSA